MTRHILTITELSDAESPFEQVVTERLKLTLDAVTPEQLQDIMGILYRTQRKPRKDRGSVRKGKTGTDSQNELPGT